MSQSTRRSNGGGVILPVASPPQPSVQLDTRIDIAASEKSGKKEKSKSKSKSKSKGKSKQQQQDDDDDTLDPDDPFSTPSPAASAAASSSSTSTAPSSHQSSTAGSEFYDSFAALEEKIAAGSLQLSAIIKCLKLIRLHPDKAERLGDELDDKLNESRTLLDEIQLIHKKFVKLATQGDFDREEQSKRTSLRDRVSQDIRQMQESHRKLVQASQVHINTDDQDEQDADLASHHSLLSGNTNSTAPAAYQLEHTYQNADYITHQQEYIGELDGHLAMLAQQAAERNEFMKRIENDVVQVHDLFRDVNAMVNAQQPMIDDIDTSISETKDNAAAGLDHIYQAQQYQQSKRKKMCFLVLMLVVALLLFFLFVWVVSGSG